jgi:hypothetical protein
VRVDQAPADPVESREVDLADGTRVDRIEIARGVESVVARIDPDVVHVEEHSASRAARHLGDELPFGNRRVREREIRRHVLDQELGAVCVVSLRTRGPAT